MANNFKNAKRYYLYVAKYYHWQFVKKVDLMTIYHEIQEVACVIIIDLFIIPSINSILCHLGFLVIRPPFTMRPALIEMEIILPGLLSQEDRLFQENVLVYCKYKH